ncbi:hypothetical protein BGLA2_1210003 [Burkholderia gladioli]|nr:hypothetical protein BGLA2_1210003 [Burkholderia gladioli]
MTPALRCLAGLPAPASLTHATHPDTSPQSHTNPHYFETDAHRHAP